MEVRHIITITTDDVCKADYLYPISNVVVKFTSALVERVQNSKDWQHFHNDLAKQLEECQKKYADLEKTSDNKDAVLRNLNEFVQTRDRIIRKLQAELARLKQAL